MTTPGTIPAQTEPAGAGGSVFRRRLAAIVAIGAVWRLGYLVVAKFGAPLLLNDSLYFSIQAGRNSEGDWFREGLTSLPGAEHGPLTSLWLTPWSIGSLGVDAQRLGMTVIGIAVIAAVGVAGRRLGGPVVGLVAAGIAAAYPNLWINDSLVMSESLACLLIAVALAVALDIEHDPTPRRAVVLGVVVGLACLTRSELGLLAIGFAGLAWGRSRRALVPALILAATALTITPWVVYNLTQFERTVVLTTNDGTTLLGANCDRTYYADLGGWDIRCLDAVPNDDTIDASIRSAARRDVAVDYVEDHVTRVPVVVMARVGRTLDVYGLSSLVALDTGEEKAEWAVWLGMACWWVLAVAAIVGWRVLGRDADTSWSRWWLVVPLAAVLLTTILFYGAHRIRAPAEPAVVLLAAVGLVHAWGWVTDRRWQTQVA